jgi:transcriptional regulator with XRE-family HTH domain
MRFATVTAEVDGPAIKALRKQQGLTLDGLASQVAEKLGSPTNKATLSRIENNRLQPSQELFDALCEVLDGDPKQLLTIAVPAELVEFVRKLIEAERATCESRAS